MKYFVAICLFLICHHGLSQINLVPNPSFEDSISVPFVTSELGKCYNWFDAAGSPDYFSTYSPIVTTMSLSVHIPNNCLGYQNARTKKFYTGIFLMVNPNSSVPPFLNYRECIGVQLLQPLLANHSYSFTMYHSLSDGSGKATNQLTAFFSPQPFTLFGNPYDTNSYFNHLETQIKHDSSFITDTANWVPLTDCFIAKGGEAYLTIGNFKDALHSTNISVNASSFTCVPELLEACYIYIDDVSLYDMGLYLPAVCRNDTVICNGTNLLLANNIKDSSVVSWSPSTALSCTNCANPVASPTTTTLYYINKTICGAASKDSILVKVHTPTATANAGIDKISCNGEQVQIGIQDSVYFTSYNWQNAASLSCSNCAMPFANPYATTIYTVQRTECSTITTDTVKVVVEICDLNTSFPNTFTPNEDGINDAWRFNLGTGNVLNSFAVYNRWGNLVHTIERGTFANAHGGFWDGRTTSGEACTEGVYFYVLEYTNTEGKVNKLKGYISLFR